VTSPQVQLVLWVVQPVLLAAVALAMFRRNIHRQFPFFFIFTIAQVVIFGVEFSVYQLAQYHAYYFAYWTAMAINLVLDFKIIHEIFLDIFRPYHALRDLGTALFKWAALIMVLVSAVLISTNPVWNDPMSRSFLMLQRCMRVVQCGLVLLLLAFCKHLNVSWRRHSFGIALGFGMLAGGELISHALYSGAHISSDLLNISLMGAYNAGVVVWLSYSVLASREPMLAVLVPQRWDNALMDLHPHSEPESLIPMFEHMVDRAFSRTQDGHA
jgi:hypothetical protein